MIASYVLRFARPKTRRGVRNTQYAIRNGLSMDSTTFVVFLSAILFTIGVLGVLLRRSALLIFMSVELMLNAANLAFVAYAHRWVQLDGQIFVFFVMAVAAAEVAVGLALIVTIFRTKRSTNVDDLAALKG